MENIWSHPSLSLKDIPGVQFISGHEPSEEFYLGRKMPGPKLFSLAFNISMPEHVSDLCINILDS
jgi:hypothetical protein